MTNSTEGEGRDLAAELRAYQEAHSKNLRTIGEQSTRLHELGEELYASARREESHEAMLREEVERRRGLATSIGAFVAQVAGLRDPYGTGDEDEGVRHLVLLPFDVYTERVNGAFTAGTLAVAPLLDVVRALVAKTKDTHPEAKLLAAHFDSMRAPEPEDT